MRYFALMACLAIFVTGCGDDPSPAERQEAENKRMEVALEKRSQIATKQQEFDSRQEKAAKVRQVAKEKAQDVKTKKKEEVAEKEKQLTALEAEMEKMKVDMNLEVMKKKIDAAQTERTMRAEWIDWRTKVLKRVNRNLKLIKPEEKEQDVEMAAQLAKKVADLAADILKTQKEWEAKINGKKREIARVKSEIRNGI